MYFVFKDGKSCTLRNWNYRLFNVFKEIFASTRAEQLSLLFSEGIQKKLRSAVPPNCTPKRSIESSTEISWCWRPCEKNLFVTPIIPFVSLIASVGTLYTERCFVWSGGTGAPGGVGTMNASKITPFYWRARFVCLSSVQASVLAALTVGSEAFGLVPKLREGKTEATWLIQWANISVFPLIDRLIDSLAAAFVGPIIAIIVTIANLLETWYL